MDEMKPPHSARKPGLLLGLSCCDLSPGKLHARQNLQLEFITVNPILSLQTLSYISFNPFSPHTEISRWWASKWEGTQKKLNKLPPWVIQDVTLCNFIIYFLGFKCDFAIGNMKKTKKCNKMLYEERCSPPVLFILVIKQKQNNFSTIKKCLRKLCQRCVMEYHVA